MITRKIMKIVSHCTDCEFSKEYQELAGNTSFVLICNFERDEGLEIPKNPFLIAQSNNKIKDYCTIGIPNNCPLETYEKD
ncbi:hypothetical protein CMV40_07010 [Elizabethkingia anophelis]|nr:hypothetical protein EAAG1_007010 [Elizabethkingia anophelis Ag1]ATC43293.1 hypothetical protein CMV41_07010 [Elizabethkingia anophelis]ATC46969.1 hypothetical protein CMV40_07010 [Elizabethkingia anophelis]